MKHNDSRIVLITGATRGLGLEAGKRLALSGHQVLLAGRDGDAAERKAQEVRSAGGTAESLRLDVRDAQSIEAAVQTIDQRYGRLDVLVNNAGVMQDGSWSGNTSEHVSEAVLRETFEQLGIILAHGFQDLSAGLRSGLQAHGGGPVSRAGPPSSGQAPHPA